MRLLHEVSTFANSAKIFLLYEIHLYIRFHFPSFLYVHVYGCVVIVIDGSDPSLRILSRVRVKARARKEIQCINEMMTDDLLTTHVHGRFRMFLPMSD